MLKTFSLLSYAALCHGRDSSAHSDLTWEQKMALDMAQMYGDNDPLGHGDFLKGLAKPKTKGEQ
jgi:hypothetical protein